MAALPYIQLYVADYLADTHHLTTEEHGAYLLLIFSYWQTGKPLKVGRLASAARMSNERWTSVEHTLKEFFEEVDGVWVHLRVERDLEKVATKSGKNSEAGKASAAARAFAKQQLERRAREAESTNAERVLNERLTIEDTDTDIDQKQDQKLVTQPEASLGKCEVFNGVEFAFPDQQLLKWKEAYPKTDVESEIRKAAVWAAANPKKAKKNWARFMNSWLAKAELAAGPVEGDCPVDKIIDLYHRECPSFAPVAVKTDRALRGVIVERWAESEAHQKSVFWSGFFRKARNKASVFYRGENCIPRLEALMSRAIFREIEEAA